MIPSKFYKPETIDNRLATPIRVGTFQEAHKIWKNLFHGLDIWVSKRPNNHEGDFFKFCVILRKSELYGPENEYSKIMGHRSNKFPLKFNVLSP